MNKSKLMMKAVIQLNGEMDRNYNGLVYATSKNPSFSEGTVGHWGTDSKSGFLEHMDDHGTWGWLCTRAEFDQFIDGLIEGCIKWDKPKWDGVGLPPVGAECEAKHFNSFEPVEIVAHVRSVDGIKAVWQLIGYNEWGYYGKAEHFRPIKTEAEKEREGLINAGMNSVARAMNSSSYEQDWDQHRRTIAALVDSGWKCDMSQNGESDV